MGQYRVVQKLAAGGMAEVFLGKVVGAGGFEKPVAIKRMLPELARDPRSADAFLYEARLCVNLVHPNVVQVLDLGTSSGQPYFVMELVDGPDLRQVINAAQRCGNPITPPEAVHVVTCVADALAYAYCARGPSGAPLRVVHRDVNPSNVLISMQGDVKLADFGVAKAADGREATRTNMVKGKLGYLAPELLNGTEASHASDIFLAGAMLYELLAGRALFPATGTTSQVLAMIAAHDEHKVALPQGQFPELLEVVRRAVAKLPENRYGTARELADALRGVMRDRHWSVSAPDIARRVAELFPGRASLCANLGAGTPLVEDPPPQPRQTTLPPAAEPANRRRRIGEMLVQAGLITEAQLQTVLARQRQEGGRLGEWVVSLDFAPARAVLGVLAKQLQLPFISDEKILEAKPPAKALERFSEELALRLLALPIGEREGVTFVAMTDPADLQKVDLLRFHLGSKIQLVVCTEFGVRRAITRHYRVREEYRWRQVDPASPLAHLTGRLIEFDEPAAPQAAPAAPAPVPTPAVTVAPYPVGPFFPQPAQVVVAPLAPSGTQQVAYVPAGIGPDGQQYFVAVPLAQFAPGVGIPAGPPTVALRPPRAAVESPGATELVLTESDAEPARTAPATPPVRAQPTPARRPPPIPQRPEKVPRITVPMRVLRPSDLEPAADVAASAGEDRAAGAGAAEADAPPARPNGKAGESGER